VSLDVQSVAITEYECAYKAYKNAGFRLEALNAIKPTDVEKTAAANAAKLAAAESIETTFDELITRQSNLFKMGLVVCAPDAPDTPKDQTKNNLVFDAQYVLNAYYAFLQYLSWWTHGMNLNGGIKVEIEYMGSKSIETTAREMGQAVLRMTKKMISPIYPLKRKTWKMKRKTWKMKRMRKST
jgi:hypothetical protein